MRRCAPGAHVKCSNRRWAVRPQDKTRGSLKEPSLLKCASMSIGSPARDLHTGLGYNIDQSGNVDKTLEEHESLVGVVEEIN